MCCSYLISLVHIALHLCSIGYSRSHDIVYSKHYYIYLFRVGRNYSLHMVTGIQVIALSNSNSNLTTIVGFTPNHHFMASWVILKHSVLI